MKQEDTARPKVLKTSSVLTSADMALFNCGPAEPMKKNSKASKKSQKKKEKEAEAKKKAQDKKKAEDKKAAKQPQKETFATPEKTPEKTLKSSDNTYKSSKKNRLGSSAYHKACAAGARKGFSHRFCLKLGREARLKALEEAGL